MALYVTDTGKRSELQEKLAAELREKIASQSAGDGDKVSKLVDKLPDHVEDSEYLKTYKKSAPIPRVAVVLIVLAVIVIIFGLVIALVV